MKFVQCLSALILSVGVMAEDLDGTMSRFDGRYYDPNHSHGYKVVTVTSPVDEETGLRSGVCVGSDTTMSKPDY